MTDTACRGLENYGFIFMKKIILFILIISLIISDTNHFTNKLNVSIN